MENKTLRIVSWNCKCGFDGKKPETINKLNADILVIPECREIDKLSMDKFGFKNDWYGDHEEAKCKSGGINETKDLGIGVFWKNGITVKKMSKWEELKSNSDFRY